MYTVRARAHKLISFLVARVNSRRAGSIFSLFTAHGGTMRVLSRGPKLINPLGINSVDPPLVEEYEEHDVYGERVRAVETRATYTVYTSC